MKRFHYHDENGKAHTVEGNTGSGVIKNKRLVVTVDKKILCRDARQFTSLPEPAILPPRKPVIDDE